MPEEFFKQAQRESKWVLLDFGAQWCSTCRPVETMLEKDIVPQWSHKVILVKADVHQRPDLVEEYHILSVPTLILCSPNGEVLWRKSGYLRREEVEAALRK